MSEIQSGTGKKTPAVSRAMKWLVKIAITVLCFWYISTKIDFYQAWQSFKQAGWSFLFVAFIFFTGSKFLSAIRLNIYFGNIGLAIPGWQNIKLYWLGMFYNLFLPGAISGDAYKVVLLNRRYKAPYKKTSAAVLLDRFSGLFALGLILSAYGIIVLRNPVFALLLVAGSLLSIGGFYLVVRFIMKDFLPGFAPTFFWGLAVQAAQVICIYFILLSLHIPFRNEWIFIFLASAVISVLPISLGGGLGTREVVFAEGARFFHLDPQLGVLISLMFYLLTVLGSVWGLYFQFHDPLREGGISDPTGA